MRKSLFYGQFFFLFRASFAGRMYEAKRDIVCSDKEMEESNAAMWKTACALWVVAEKRQTAAMHKSDSA